MGMNGKYVATGGEGVFSMRREIETETVRGLTSGDFDYRPSKALRCALELGTVTRLSWIDIISEHLRCT